MVFSGAWMLVSPLLPKRTREKVEIVSSRSALSTLLEHIDEDELPMFLGGKKPDSETGCCNAGPVPQGLSDTLPDGPPPVPQEQEQQQLGSSAVKLSKVVEL